VHPFLRVAIVVLITKVS